MVDYPDFPFACPICGQDIEKSIRWIEQNPTSSALRGGIDFS